MYIPMLTVFFNMVKITEPEFVNLKGAKESIPAGLESIPGLLKRFTKPAKLLRK
jgi:hypothetical protein